MELSLYITFTEFSAKKQIDFSKLHFFY